jgi:hypothetical protein
MPIVVTAPDSVTQGLQRIRIGDLPDFNGTDPDFVVTDFTGWHGARVGVPTLVANGGGPGAVAVDEEPAEAYYTIVGSIDHRGDWAALEESRGLLFAGLLGGERSVQVLDERAGVDKQIFVRAYDTPELVPFGAAILPFSFPLVAPDPYKYALEPVTGNMGVFTGQKWFREYDPVTFARTYELGSAWSRTYAQAVPTGPFPTALTLTSPGDATSRRVTITVTGPLTAGDWWLLNETTGGRLWVEVPVLSSQELVLDMAARTARLSGSPVDHLVYGDWLSMAPGPNLFRLVSGTSSEAFAFVSALPAYL